MDKLILKFVWKRKRSGRTKTILLKRTQLEDLIKLWFYDRKTPVIKTVWYSCEDTCTDQWDIHGQVIFYKGAKAIKWGFIYFERHMGKWGRGRQKEGERQSQVGSASKPHTELDLTLATARSRPEPIMSGVECLNQLSQPGAPSGNF